jgi:hypothetical protein
MNVEARTEWTVSSFIGAEKVPSTIRNLASFARPNYMDCFVMETLHSENSPEVWARAILEKSSLSPDARLLWTLMGLRMGPPHSSDHVQGWLMDRQDDHWLRLETSSWYLSASVVFLVEPGRVSASLSLQYDSPVAPFIWATVSHQHQKAVPVMMRQAARFLLERHRRRETDRTTLRAGRDCKDGGLDHEQRETCT